MFSAIEFSLIPPFLRPRACLIAEDTDVVLAWFPIAYSSGFQSIMTTACIGGTCIVCSPAISFELFVDLVDKFKVSNAGALVNLASFVRMSSRKLRCLNIEHCSSYSSLAAVDASLVVTLAGTLTLSTTFILAFSFSSNTCKHYEPERPIMLEGLIVAPQRPCLHVYLNRAIW